MQLSRLGQGLAVSAVSALVITGLAVSAPAAVAADGAAVRLISQADGVASVKRDANSPGGTSIALAAQVLDPRASVTFEYNSDPSATNDATDWVSTGPVTMTLGYAYTPWSADSSLVGTSIALRAVAVVPADGSTPETRTYSLLNDVAVTGQDSPEQAVSIGEVGPDNPAAPGAFFAQPYASTGRTASLLAVTGLTSATDGTVELSAWNPQAGVFQGGVAAAVEPTTLKAPNPGGGINLAPGGTFTGVLDIEPFGVDDGDVLAVRARRDTDAVYPAELVSQQIAAISQTDGTGDVTPTGAEVTLTVFDPFGGVVVGAEVHRSSDGARVGYTDSSGSIVVEQAPDTTESYYANTTDVDAFEDGVDVQSEAVTTGAYEAVPVAAEAVLADGDVFDDREYAPGDIAVQVLDAYGLPYAGEATIDYSLHHAGTPAPELETVATDADGRFVVPFDPSGPDGDQVLTFLPPPSPRDREETTVTFTAGDARLGLTPLAGTGTSGGTISYAGTLTVEGKALPGRTVDLAYARGTEQAPGTTADAGLGSQRAVTSAVATAPDGTFAATVSDALETGNPAETGGRLTVSARGLGDSLTATADFAAGPAAPTTPTVDLPRVKVGLKGSSTGAKDKLRVSAPRAAARAKVELRAKIGTKWRVVKRARLDRKGDVTLAVRDRNGAQATRYRVVVQATDTVARSTSKVVRVR